MRDFLHSGALLPLTPLLARVEFLGEMSNVLHSRAPLPLIPPTPFSHKGRRGSLGVLTAEMGDGAQGLAKKPTLVSRHLPRTQPWVRGRPARTQPCAPSRGRRHLPRTQHRPITNAQASRPHSPWVRGRPARTQPCAPSRGREHHVLDRPVRMSPLAPWQTAQIGNKHHRTAHMVIPDVLSGAPDWL